MAATLVSCGRKIISGGRKIISGGRKIISGSAVKNISFSETYYMYVYLSSSTNGASL